MYKQSINLINYSGSELHHDPKFDRVPSSHVRSIPWTFQPNLIIMPNDIALTRSYVTDENTKGYTYKQKNRRTDKQTNGRMERRTEKQTDLQIWWKYPFRLKPRSKNIKMCFILTLAASLWKTSSRVNMLWKQDT